MSDYPCKRDEVLKHLETFKGKVTEGLVFDTIHTMMQSHEHYLASMDRDVLEDFPASEMYQQSTYTDEPDWMSIWNASRDKLGNRTSASLAVSNMGPFIAKKKDPIWRSISRFNRPYPPFEFGSSMWLRDADEDLARSLNVIR